MRMRMLSHVTIQNFQSLTNVSLELKPFTVIVGPSSAGKSAFTRALKTLTGNQRGDSFITHGAHQTTIIAKTDRGTVALLRGKKNEYVLIPEGDAERQVFTKLSGSTPEEVSAFIGIPAKDPLNYADQFDMPYLLRSTAGDVARTLGELTNVHVIFEASREANRRRLEASRLLGTRTKDYAELTKDLDKYVTLSDDLIALEQAEDLLKDVLVTEQKLDALDVAIMIASRETNVPDPRALPKLDTAEKSRDSIIALNDLIARLVRSNELIMAGSRGYLDAHEALNELEQEYLDVLREIGTCPTCGQETHDIHEHTAITG